MNKYFLLTLCLLMFLWQCDKSFVPDNPFTDYDPAQDTVKFIFKDPDSSSIAGLFHYIFKPTCSNAGCHDGTFEPDFRTLESSYNTLILKKAIKQDGKYFIRVKPFAPDESALLARLNNIISPQMPIQIEPDSDWGKNKTKYIALIEQWIRNGAPAIDGSESKEGTPQVHLHGCYASYRDTGIIERRTLNGALLIDSLMDTVDLFFAFKHDAQNPLSFTGNQIKFSTHPHLFDTSQISLNMELVQPPLRQIGLYGDSVNYTHKIQIITNHIFQTHKQVYFRTNTTDIQNHQSELPTDKAIFSMKKYMSFERL